MNDDQILKQLYSTEEDLAKRLNATRQAIVAFGGRITGKQEAKTVVKETPTPVPAPVAEVVEPPRPIKVTSPRITREEVYGYMNEVFKEVGIPLSCNVMQFKLAQLGMQYNLPNVSNYMADMVKEGEAIRIARGKYAHVDYSHPTALVKKVVTMMEVEQYIRLRKEVTRKELIDMFVKGGRMSESMVDLRINRLLTNRIIKRKEAGVYKLRKYV